MTILKFKTSLISLLIFYIFSTLALANPPNWPPKGLDVAIEAQSKHGAQLLHIDGIIGHGITTNENGVAAIMVFAEKPLLRNIPQQLDDVPVIVQFTGRFYALAPPKCGGPPSSRPDECFTDDTSQIDPTARFERPVPIGVSTGHPNITAGTIGARVTDGTYFYALSNNHVFANSNDALIGDDIWQPGAYDGGTSADTYSHLTDFAVIDFYGGNNLMDAAIAITDTSLLSNTTPSDGYGIPSSTPVSASVGLSVQKYGRTTGFTQGSVEAINATVDVCYEGQSICTKLAKFIEQVVIVDGSFSAGGDSGSLVVTKQTNQPVALLFAGSSSHTIATPINTVLTEFNVTIDGVELNEPPSPTDFTLSALGYKVRGLQKVDLTWVGSSAQNVDIYRDGSLISTTVNDGEQTDAINQKGGGSYLYQLCEAGTSTCSNNTTVNF